MVAGNCLASPDAQGIFCGGLAMRFEGKGIGDILKFNTQTDAVNQGYPGALI